ncbi:MULTISPECIES: type II toxin-antitoxin system VapB family antitoxin [unclassified Sphingomonas]|jgi:antitoxin VapB|uniref:type II toxin-antitoxin system VapB family antitoxin n=1 Tax=unclassified Sphingomonas TaxID=196159 RepID=UPI0025CC2A7B|nr:MULTISPECIES: type II toxin-antitoxin system VapB family antitoxin [unclassified Sphingomonas]
MGINIKHDAYEQAIRELAASRGLSLTDAIGMAVCNELQRDREAERKAGFMARVREAQAIFAAAPMIDPRTPDEILGYDENGLPT